AGFRRLGPGRLREDGARLIAPARRAWVCRGGGAGLVRAVVPAQAQERELPVTALLLACPYCFGAADSTQVQSAKIGVLVLLGIIVPGLGAIGLVAHTWAKRARALSASQQSQAS